MDYNKLPIDILSALLDMMIACLFLRRILFLKGGKLRVISALLIGVTLNVIISQKV